MKVRVTVTLDVDADAWVSEYGLTDRSEVRGDVQDWARYLLLGALEQNGMSGP